MLRHKSPNVATVLGTAALLMFGAACGDGDDQGAASNPERYCELSAEMERRGEAAFGPLGENAPPESFVAAARQMVTTSGDLLQELEATAPGAIQNDVKKLVEAQRSLANGDVQALDRVSQEDERVNAWEERNCS